MPFSFAVYVWHDSIRDTVRRILANAFSTGFSIASTYQHAMKHRLVVAPRLGIDGHFNIHILIPLIQLPLAHGLSAKVK